MAMTPGFFRKKKHLRCVKLAPKGNGILMEGTWNDARNARQEAVQMP
jgi:hypothetical protein